jgi:hypothetical protein
MVWKNGVELKLKTMDECFHISDHRKLLLITNTKKIWNWYINKIKVQSILKQKIIGKLKPPRNLCLSEISHDNRK